ncbi:ABC transporter permease [Candidatus Izemoplasma sp. B36]|uniref:ABC transporter permease n=1 Tax=Candidatus Izemoplasma sp. B36 TaxID=3242468 RepID=UPI003556C7FA
MKKTGLTILSIFFIFLVWVIAGAIVDNSLLLPKPIDVIVAFGKIFIETDSLSVILFTILRLLVGVLIASIFGLLLGVLAGFKNSFATFFNPLVTILRTVPVISITVILLIIFGFSLTPYIITFLMLFPLIYQGTYGAITNIDSELIDVYKLEDDNFWSGLMHCYFPLISKNIRTSLLQSLGLGIKVLVMAEYLSQTKNSIGNQLYLAKVNLLYDEVFAWTFLLIFIALLFELLINHYKPITEKIRKGLK